MLPISLRYVSQQCGDNCSELYLTINLVSQFSMCSYPWRESTAWSLPFWKLRFKSNLLPALWTWLASSPFGNTSNLKPWRSALCFANKSNNSLYPFAYTIFPRKYAPFVKGFCPSSLYATIISPIFNNLGFTPRTLKITDFGKSWVAA